jgi:hypothetical protein
VAVSAGANVVNSGLVFAFDAGADANFGATISTNKYGTTTTFLYGTGSSFEDGSNPTNEIVLLENPSNYSPYVLRQNGNQTEYQINLTTQLASSTTYVLSGWYAKSSDYNGSDTMFHCRAFSTSGNHVALGTGIGTVIKTQVVGGITWSYCYTTITTPSDYSNSFNWYVGYGTNNTAGYRYYANLRMEEGTFPTLKNLKSSSNNVVPINGPTYSTSNGGSIVFDGSNDYLTLGNLGTIGNYQTVDVWFYSTSVTNYRNMLDMNYANYVNTGNVGPRLEQSTGGATGWVWSGNTTNNSLLNGQSTSYSISANTWYNATWVCDNGTVAVYLNGVATQTGIASTNGFITTYAAASVGRGFHLDSSRYFTGNIPILRIYNKALSATEVLQNFNAQRDRFGI